MASKNKTKTSSKTSSKTVSSKTNAERAKMGYSSIPGQYNSATGKLNTPVNNIVSKITGGKYSSYAIKDTSGRYTPFGISLGYGKQSTTTLSTGNIPKKITNNNIALDNIYKKGITTDTNTGTSMYPDGSAYDESKLKTADTKTEDAQIENYWNEMKKNTDAITSSMISNIQSRYAGYKQAQEEVNKSLLAGTTNALLMSGAAQHDVYSQDAINYRINQNNQEIQNLEAKENEEINTAKQLQMEGNQKILESQLAQIQDTRKEKIAATQKLNDTIIEAQQKANETAIQSKVDNLVADVYSQGITDPGQILTKLNALGYGITSEQVSETLNILNKNLEEFKKMQTDVINSAQTAGDYATASKVLSLDPKSPTFQKDLAKLQGEVYKKAKATSITQNKKAIINEGTKKLDKSRGSDGWVDPAVYLEAYEDWIAENIGTKAEFLKEFPPEDYVNPENDTLPVYLQNKKKKTTPSNREI